MPHPHFVSQSCNNPVTPSLSVWLFCTYGWRCRWQGSWLPSPTWLETIGTSHITWLKNVQDFWDPTTSHWWSDWFHSETPSVEVAAEHPPDVYADIKSLIKQQIGLLLVCVSVWLLLRTKFRIHRTINRWDIVKHNFKYGSQAPCYMGKISILCHGTILGMNVCVCTPNLISGWDSDKTIFKMAFLLHLQFFVNRTINRRDIAKGRFSIWQPSTILHFVWRHHIASGNTILHS